MALKMPYSLIGIGKQGVFMKLLLAILCSFFLCLPAHSKEIVLTSDNTLILADEVMPNSVSRIMDNANTLDAKVKSKYPFYLFLYTPGGSVRAGMELIEYMKGLNRPIHTITLFAASMGFQIAQHLDDRYIFRYGTLMSHKARGGFFGEFGGGLSQLDSRYTYWLRIFVEMDRQTVKRTEGKQTLKTYRSAYEHEMWVLGDESVRNGYADEVVSVKCDSTLLKGLRKVSFKFFMFDVTLWFSKCPVDVNVKKYTVAIITNKGKMDLNQFIRGSGRFGDPNCKDEASIIQNTEYSNNSTSINNFSSYTIKNTENKNTIIEKKSICALNSELTLKKLYDKAKELESYYNNKFNGKVKYSY